MNDRQTWAMATALTALLAILASKPKAKQIPAPPDDGLLDRADLVGSVAVADGFDDAWWERALGWD